MPRRTAARTLPAVTLGCLCLVFAGSNVLAQTTTVPFDFDGFTEIVVSTVFNVTVIQGPDFVVEVTIDADEVNSLEVTQTGSRLNLALSLGDHNIETLEGRVTLPVLNSISLNGVARATLVDFNQTELAVNVGVASQMYSDSLTISNLTASVSGTSNLNFGNINPVDTASISVSGVSSATVNMNVDSSLTGSVSGVSRLSYYGTNVAVDVEVGSGSSLVRLGDTRPGGVIELLYFAQFGNGQGFTSDVVLTNTSAAETATGTIDFFNDSGDPLPVGIVDENATTTSLLVEPRDVASSVNFSIQPRGVITISTDGAGDLVAGSAVVTSDERLGGVIRFRTPGIGIAGVGASPPLEDFVVPVRRQAVGINTGLAIHNTAGQSVTLELILRDKEGLEVARRTIVDFPAGGHLAQFIGGDGEVLFAAADTANFQSSVTVLVGGGKVAATALELGTNPGEFTTVPVISLD